MELCWIPFPYGFDCGVRRSRVVACEIHGLLVIIMLSHGVACGVEEARVQSWQDRACRMRGFLAITNSLLLGSGEYCTAHLVSYIHLERLVHLSAYQIFNIQVASGWQASRFRKQREAARVVPASVAILSASSVLALTTKVCGLVSDIARRSESSQHHC